MKRNFYKDCSKCREWLKIEGQEICSECGEVNNFILFTCFISSE